jgi:uncharacterized membrane protein YraQ (UPF0718 family)
MRYLGGYVMKKNKTLFISILLILLLCAYNFDLGLKALKSAGFQFYSMLLIVPPIFLLIGLLDVWVPKDVMIKLMGEKSGLIGILIAFTFGTLAAGPLVGAFPVAMIMLKKGAKYSNVLFFLMIWASAKLPILLYQISTLGIKFTLAVNITLILVYLMGSILVEKMFTEGELNNLYEKARNM